MIARFLYFLFFGWWLGLVSTLAAYILCLSVVGLPLGVMIFNRLPTLLYLKEPGDECDLGYDHRHIMNELPFLLRVLWFFVVGWHLGLIALVAGYLVALTIVGIPFSIYILNRIPLMMTLSRHYSRI